MKLNTQIRKAILEAALKKAGIPEKKIALRQGYAAWVEAVRSASMPIDTDQIIAKAESILSPVTEKNPSIRVSYSKYSYLRVNVAGQSRKIYFNGNADSDDETPSVCKLVPYSDPALLGGSQLVDQIFALDDQSKKLKEEINHLTASINAVLNSVTTDKKLIEIWPESVAFIPAAEKASQSNLPALQISELNKALGLP